VAVKSNLISECLGNYLVRRGRLTREDFEESLAKVKRGDGRHGEILVVMDLLSEEEVSCTLSEQAEEKLFEIFEWLDGCFDFKIDARISRGNELALTRSPANMIVEGSRRRLPIELVDAFVALNADSFVVQSRNPFYRLQEIDLDAKEAELLAMVNGQRKLDYFQTADPAFRRVLYGLISTQILELQDVATLADDSLSVSGPISPAPSEKEADRPMRAELAAMVERLRGETYFEMFAVSSTAASPAIRSAYVECARRVHPDRYQNASGAMRQLAQEAFEILSKAHETLLDPRRRSEYELELRMGERKAAKRAENERFLAAEIEFQKGETNLRCRNYEDALAEFGKALELNDSEGEYHAHYGWCLFLCHQDNEVMIEEAIEHVRRGAKLARDRDKPYLFLGRLYKVMGRISAAEKMFARAVQIQPNCVDALRELRLINMRRKKKRSLLSRFFPTRGRSNESVARRGR
jgi:tetratricopeptide (TPR) repeat protein